MIYHTVSALKIIRRYLLLLKEIRTKESIVLRVK